MVDPVIRQYHFFCRFFIFSTLYTVFSASIQPISTQMLSKEKIIHDLHDFENQAFIREIIYQTMFSPHHEKNSRFSKTNKIPIQFDYFEIGTTEKSTRLITHTVGLHGNKTVLEAITIKNRQIRNLLRNNRVVCL